MTQASECPREEGLARLAAGEARADELEALLGHVEGCPACQAKVKDLVPAHTLVDNWANVKRGDGVEDKIVNRLIDGLTHLAGAATISVKCSHCGKALKTKVQLAGKKVKCPGCGQAVLVPAAAEKATPPGPPLARGGKEGAEDTIPPRGASSDADTPTIPPERAAPLPAPRSATQANVGPPPKEDDEVAWDFLAPPQAPDEIGRLGPYRILKVLGHGGMGVVFRAEDPSLERIVALKAMLPSLAASPSAKKRFLREAKTAAAIKHDHIVTIHQVGEDRGAPYLAMEFLHGEALDERLKREGKLSVAESLRIGKEVAEGLAAAHEENLIHRDIKPANIWLETKKKATAENAEAAEKKQKSRSLSASSAFSALSSGRVKILDFGLARATDDSTGLTQSGAIIGTPAYMAPEQAQGGDVDHRCDLFSLGCMLYFMATGKTPFKGKDTISTLMSVATDTPTPPCEVNAEVPEQLSDYILKLLAKDPKERPDSAHQVAAALAEMQAAWASDKTAALLPSGGRKSSMPAPTSAKSNPRLDNSTAGRAEVPRSPTSRRGLLVGLALGVVAAAVAGIVYFMQTPHGTVRIEINDPKIKVAIGDGDFTIQGADKHNITLTPGTHGLRVRRDDFSFDTTKFELKKGETVTLTVEWFAEGKVQVRQGDKLIGEARVKDADGTPPPNLALDLQDDGGVDMPSLKLNDIGDQTTEAWVLLDPEPRKKVTPFLLGQAGYNTFHVNPEKKELQCGKGVVSVALPMPKRWTHIAAVRVGLKSLFFMDGKYIGEFKKPFAKPDIEGFFRIGGAKGARSTAVDEVRISKVARYDTDFTPDRRFKADENTIALYHCDEGQGDKLIDASTHGHHGTITGCKWVKVDETAPPPPNLALDLQDNGTVEVPSLNLSEIGDLTVEARVLVEAEGLKKNAGPFLFGEPGAASFRLQRIKNEIQLGRSSSSAVPIPVPKRWVHIAAVRSGGGKATFFLDGKKVGELKKGGGKAKLDLQLEKDFFRIGDILGNVYAAVDEVRISNKVRYTTDFIVPDQRFEVDADTLALYHCDEGQGDKLIDASRHGHHGTITGCKWVRVEETAPAPMPGHGLRFFATSSVKVPTLGLDSTDVAKPLTLEAYVTPWKDQSHKVFGFGSLLHLDAVRSTSKKVPDGWYLAVGLGKNVRVGPAEVAVKRRVHLAGVFDGVGFSLFVDGKLIASREKGSLAKWLDKGDTQLFLGDGFDGVIEQVRISKTARYAKEFTPARRFAADADTLALYHFDEGQGQTLNDSSGNNHHGAISGCEWIKVDKPETKPPLPPPGNSALQFDGQTSYVDLPTVAVDTTQPFTLEARVQPQAKEALMRILGNSIGTEGLAFWISPDGTLTGRMAGPGASRTTTTEKPIGMKWSHVALVYDGETLRIFMDGQQFSKVAGTNKIPSSKVPFRIGAGYKGLNPLKAIGPVGKQPSDVFNGLIDEVRISKVARYKDNTFTPSLRFEPDQDTIGLYHFDEGDGNQVKDSSGNRHDGKITGAKWVKADGAPIAAAASVALEFDGQSSYVDVPTLERNSVGPATLEVWARNGFKGPKLAQLIRSNGKAPCQLHVTFLGHLGCFERTGDFNANGHRETHAPKPWVAGAWTHVAYVIDAGEARLFIDGALATRTKGNFPAALASATLRGTWIGAEPPNGFFFKGELAGVRISKSARYDNDFTPAQRFEPDADTLALYHMDDGQGDVLKDSSGNGHDGKITGAKWVKADQEK